MEHYPEAKDIAKTCINRLSMGVIDGLIARYPDDLLNSSRKELLRKYLSGKIELLRKIRGEIK